MCNQWFNAIKSLFPDFLRFDFLKKKKNEVDIEADWPRLTNDEMNDASDSPHYDGYSSDHRQCNQNSTPILKS